MEEVVVVGCKRWEFGVFFFFLFFLHFIIIIIFSQFFLICFPAPKNVPELRL